MDPFEALVTVIPVLLSIKEEPSVSCVSDPEKPNDAVIAPADWSVFVVLL